MKHLETSYTTHDNHRLFLQAWMPEQPKAAILLVHGLAEHSSRYSYFAEKLAENDISVFTFDGRGHGKSSIPEPSAYFSDYKDYIKDIDALLGKVKAYSKGLPVFIFGHSMGGGLVVDYVLNYRPELKGVVLSGALLKPGENVSKILIAVSSIISTVAPKLKVLKLISSYISHDPEEVKKYNEDPLVYHKAIPARTGYELLSMMKEINGQMTDFNYPVLILHGGDDLLTNIKGSQLLYEKASSVDKTFRKYPGLYHELLNEYKKEEIINGILDWIIKRIN